MLVIEEAECMDILYAFDFAQYLSIASEQLKCIKLFTIALNFSKTMEQLLLFCWLPEKNFRTIWLEQRVFISIFVENISPGWFISVYSMN